PAAQTCCGQPAFNSGDTAHTAALARRFIEIFEPYDFVVAPSGSCIGMTRAHYPEALADDPAWA
ncbi:MAG: (Fe-S)-binding protein, partial [Rhodoferax sp.]|nr:(Fe-S)-binding protein [Rhodoferax sp.]